MDYRGGESGIRTRDMAPKNMAPFQRLSRALRAEETGRPRKAGPRWVPASTSVRSPARLAASAMMLIRLPAQASDLQLPPQPSQFVGRHWVGPLTLTRALLEMLQPSCTLLSPKLRPRGGAWAEITEHRNRLVEHGAV